MTTPTGLAVNAAHDAAQARLLDKGLAELAAIFSAVDPLNDPDYPRLAAASVAKTRSQAVEVARSGYAALRAAETGLGGAEAPFYVPTPLPPNADLLEASMRVTGPIAAKTSLANGAIMQEALTTALTQTLGAATRHVEGGARDVTRLASHADPLSGGWSRRSGGNPCYFCAMLISRGPVYSGEGTGNFRAHDHCHCKAVAFFEGDTGWTAQAAEYRELWEAAKKHPDKDFRTLFRETKGRTATAERVHSYALLVDSRRTASLAKAVAAPVEAPAKAAGNLTTEQYAAFKAEPAWSAETREASLAALRSTENGKVLADTLDKFQDGGSIARLRSSIEKRLAGEALPEMSAKRADAVIDALRHAPGDNAPEILFRGMSIKGSQKTILDRYAAGGDLDFNLTSFSSDRKVATRFQTMTATKGSTRVMVELVGDGKAVLPIQNLARDRRLHREKEWIGAGRYEVVEVKKSPSGGVILRVRQKGRI